MFKTIKEINLMVDEVEKIISSCNNDIFSLDKETLENYGSLVQSIEACLDYINTKCKRSQYPSCSVHYYLHYSSKTKHYWITKEQCQKEVHTHVSVHFSCVV